MQEYAQSSQYSNESSYSVSLNVKIAVHYTHPAINKSWFNADYRIFTYALDVTIVYLWS